MKEARMTLETMILRVIAILALVSLSTPAGGATVERIISRQDADRIFSLNRDQWNDEAKQMVHPRGWKIRLSPAETGTVVSAFDPRTGRGMSIQPLFGDAKGPPVMLVVGSYYPAGSLHQFDENARRGMETSAGSDFGAGYSVRVTHTRRAPPSRKFDVVETIITKQGE
jgi:hypothetical protein